MSKIEKIYILSGGTGGHVYPAKVVAEKFLSEETEVIWIGTSSCLLYTSPSPRD